MPTEDAMVEEFSQNVRHGDELSINTEGSSQDVFDGASASETFDVAGSLQSEPVARSNRKGARSTFIGHHTSGSSGYAEVLAHSASPSDDCEYARRFTRHDSTYVLPPASSCGRMFQLDLPHYTCAEVVLIPEGIDPSKQVWNEENNAELDVLLSALNYFHAVLNKVYWLVVLERPEMSVPTT